jgi:uncharacterized delta-60 repeat protein
MSGRRRSLGLPAFFAFVVALLVGIPVAQAVDGLDPAFGTAGVSALPLPPAASNAEAGIVDLAAGPEGGTVGALAGFAGSGYFGVARFTQSGSLDPSFGQGGFTQLFEVPLPWKEVFEPQAQGQAVAVQEDGKVVVAGYLEWGLHSPSRFGLLLARYDADGLLDPSFGQGGVIASPLRRIEGGPVFHAVAVEPGGRIIAVGARNERSGLRPPAGLVVAYRPDGSVDTSFGQGGQVLFQHRRHFFNYTGLRAVQVLGGGKILVAGYRNDALFLARLDRDGGLDLSFGGGDGIATLFLEHPGCCRNASLAIQGNGRIVVEANGGGLLTERVFLVRYRGNGRLDRSFGHGGVEAPLLPWRLSEGTDVAIQPDGGILTVGRGERTKANPRRPAYAVFRSLPDGRPDRSFGREGLRTFRIGGQSLASAALAQPDGSVLTGGSFATAAAGRYVTSLLLTRFLGLPR